MAELNVIDEETESLKRKVLATGSFWQRQKQSLPSPVIFPPYLLPPLIPEPGPVNQYLTITMEEDTGSWGGLLLSLSWPARPVMKLGPALELPPHVPFSVLEHKPASRPRAHWVCILENLPFCEFSLFLNRNKDADISFWAQGLNWYSNLFR